MWAMQRAPYFPFEVSLRLYLLLTKKVVGVISGFYIKLNYDFHPAGKARSRNPVVLSSLLLYSDGTEKVELEGRFICCTIDDSAAK